MEHNYLLSSRLESLCTSFYLVLIPYTISRFFIGFVCQRKSGKNELVEVKRQTSEKNNIQIKTKQEHKLSQNANVHFTNDFASNLELIKQQIGHNSDVRFRKFNIGRTDIQAGIVFVDGLSDKEIIDKHIMKLLMDDFSDEYKNESSYVEGLFQKNILKIKFLQLVK